MTNNTISIKALAEEFKVECKVIKLGYEYPGYTGTEKYAIVTDLSYAQIMERYAPVAEHYCPFLLLSKAAGEVIADFKRNEDKFSKRMQKDDCYGFEDGMTERYNIECLDGRGPSQIARQLEQEKVLIPTAYYASLGRKTRKQYTDPYAWDQKTVAGILVNQQYTGCTVNFMTTTVSYKVHKTVYKPKDEWQIIPNTQPAIIDEDTWKRVQELREHRIRPTATGRTSLFSGKVFCADCGSKLHFCAAKSLNANQEHYRCANYKSGRGSCQIHFIRNVVLEKIVLEAINSLADFVRCYEPVFLYLMAQKDIVSKRTETSKLRTAIESGKRRIQDLDKLIERIYEDQVLGNISAERYARMSVNYENEQRTLINKVAEDEKKLACIEQTSLDLKTILKVLRSSTSFEELTPTLVNSLIRRIEVHNNDKSSGHCYVKVDIYFTAIGLIDIPTEDEIKGLMAKIKANPQEYRLTA